jgi:sn-glycerol 3-phosphate transport system ATP-binding protein
MGLVALPDGPITLGIRAEDLSTGTQGLPVTLDYVEELGANRIVHCFAGGQRLALMQPPEAPLSEYMTLRARPQALHLFDTTRGTRLVAPASQIPEPVA